MIQSDVRLARKVKLKILNGIYPAITKIGRKSNSAFANRRI